MATKIWLDLSKSSPEVRASMIDAASRVYAAGLKASNSMNESIRRQTAREDVDDFFAKLAEIGS